jgi:alkaline phosphatase
MAHAGASGSARIASAASHPAAIRTVWPMHRPIFRFVVQFGYVRAMHRRRTGSARRLSLCLVAALAGCTRLASPHLHDRTQVVADALRGGRARNVILLIGDGMSDSEITMARNYHVGAAGRLALDTLPFSGSYTTYAVQEQNPALPDYVVDSAASATAWATGRKTSNQRLSTAASTGERLTTILELAQANGLATGNVTTAELTDATPAALAAHVNHRRCQGPGDMAACPSDEKSAGGPGSIAEQLVDHHVDVLLGGGQQRFDETIQAGPYAGQTVLQSATAQGYTVITDSTGLRAIEPAQRVLGLFATAEMTPEWSGTPALVYPGSGPQRCRENQRPEAEPSLAEMTRTAIDLLERSPAGRNKGFFLQVEGASIDKRAHVADPCGQIGETVAFDAAVRVALAYAAAHPDTLVIVTGDHAHSAQIVPPLTPQDHGPGLLSTLITADGEPMTISYATNVPGRFEEHTGAQVRIAAIGPQAANVMGVTDQTDLFHTMSRALGLES